MRRLVSSWVTLLIGAGWVTFSRTAEAFILRDCDLSVSGGFYDGSCFASEPQPLPGSTYASLRDAIQLNPAALPTFNTPYGVEFFGTNGGPLLNRPDYSFAIIKGFQRIGTGISTTSPDSFFSPDLQASMAGGIYGAAASAYAQSRERMPAIAGSVAVLPELGTFEEILHPTGALTLRYNRDTSAIELGYGFTISHRIVYAGISSTQEKRPGLPSVEIGSMVVGLRLPNLQIEYTSISSSAVGYNNTAYLYSANVAFGPAIFGASIKRFGDAAQNKLNRNLITGQLRTSKKTLLEYAFGVYQKAHSLGFQFFL